MKHPSQRPKRAMRHLHRAIEWLLPGPYSQPHPDHRRAYILIGVLLSTLLIALASVLFFLFSGPLNTTGKQTTILIILGLMAVYAADVWYFKISGSFDKATNIFVGALFVAICYGTAITGGYYDSPALQLLVIVPIYAFLLSGRSLGLWWSLIIVGAQSSFFLLSELNYHFPQTLDDTTRDNIDIYIWMLTCTLTIATLLVYESTTERLTNHLHNERNLYEYQASHDPLTGLCNRAQFQTELDIAIQEANRNSSRFAILYMDLDNFKPINDQYGHEAGDKVLRYVSEQLLQSIRASDIAARLGGDEFAILLKSIAKAEDTVIIAQKIHTILQAPIAIGQNWAQVSGSVGIALYPDHSTDAAELLKYADNAMYHAKKNRSSIKMHALAID